MDPPMNTITTATANSDNAADDDNVSIMSNNSSILGNSGRCKKYRRTTIKGMTQEEIEFEDKVSQQMTSATAEDQSLQYPDKGSLSPSSYKKVYAQVNRRRIKKKKAIEAKLQPRQVPAKLVAPSTPVAAATSATAAETPVPATPMDYAQMAPLEALLSRRTESRNVQIEKQRTFMKELLVENKQANEDLATKLVQETIKANESTATKLIQETAKANENTARNLASDIAKTNNTQLEKMFMDSGKEFDRYLEAEAKTDELLINATMQSGSGGPPLLPDPSSSVVETRAAANSGVDIPVVIPKKDTAIEQGSYCPKRSGMTQAPVRNAGTASAVAVKNNSNPEKLGTKQVPARSAAAVGSNNPGKLGGTPTVDGNPKKADLKQASAGSSEGSGAGKIAGTTARRTSRIPSSKPTTIGSKRHRPPLPPSRSTAAKPTTPKRPRLRDHGEHSSAASTGSGTSQSSVGSSMFVNTNITMMNFEAGRAIIKKDFGRFSIDSLHDFYLSGGNEILIRSKTGKIGFISWGNGKDCFPNNGFLPSGDEERVSDIASCGQQTFILGGSGFLFRHERGCVKLYSIEGQDESKAIARIHAGCDYLLFQYSDTTFAVVRDGKVVRDFDLGKNQGKSIQKVYTGGSFAVVQLEDGGGSLHQGALHCFTFGESMMEEGPIRLTKGWLGIKLAPGLEHCAILAGKAASDGNLDEEGPRRLFTFGDNAQGQLGRSASRNYITALKDIPIVDVASVGNRTYAVSDEGFLYCTGDFPKKISGNTKPQQVELGVGAHGKVKFDEIIVGKNANSLIAVQKTPNHDDLVFKLDLATHTLETVDWEGCRLVKVHETKVSGKYAVLKADFAAAED